MKKHIISFILGALSFGVVGAYAGQYIATENSFPIQLNGQPINITGYNIDGNTYFKLRDISNVVGGFSVDFNNNIIQLAKDGYVYNNDFISIPYYNIPDYSYAPDYGYFIGLGTSNDFYEYNSGYAYYYEYAYNQNNLDKYIDYLQTLGFNLHYTNNLSEFVDETPYLEKDGKYIILNKNDNVIEITLTGDLSPANIEEKTKSFIANSEIASFMQWSLPAGYIPVTDYSTYTTHAYESGLDGAKISISGKFTEISSAEGNIYGILEIYNNPNQKWIVALSSTDYMSLSKIQNILLDKYVTIGGSYMGFSDNLLIPAIMIECVSVYPNGYYTFADLIGM